MIKPLPSDLINKISAGEVVERPASALKELVENALDSGADDIVVEIEKGGSDLIRVSDNGSGMNRDDAIRCIERYTTSKIMSLSDLENIETLGFRGEALSAISSVSMFTIQTKEKDVIVGTEIIIHGNDREEINDVGCPEGTTVSVKKLFFNVPARRKFLKSERSEFNHILDIMTQFAVAWSSVSFRLSHNGKEIFRYIKSGSLTTRIKEVLGKDIADTLIDVSNNYSNISIVGVVAPPEITKRNSKQQFLFVNNRAVVDYRVASAVKRAMEPMLGSGMYPVFALFLRLPPSEVDVNVHPRKTEVKFADMQKIYSIVFSTIRDAVGKDASVFSSDVARVNIIDVKSAISRPKMNFKQSSFRPKDFSVQRWEQKPTMKQVQSSVVFTEVVLGDESNHTLDVRESETIDPLKGITLHGQVRKSFVLVEKENSLIIFDQHATAEAILFKMLKERASNNNISVQQLLVPITLEVSIGEAQIITSYSYAFKKLGFEIEAFGGNVFMIRSVPVEIVKYNIKDIVYGVIQDLQAEENQDMKNLENTCDIVLKYTACRSSIMFGDSLSDEEQRQLISDVIKHNITHCPHGRPIKWEIKWNELEKQFKR